MNLVNSKHLLFGIWSRKNQLPKSLGFVFHSYNLDGLTLDIHFCLFDVFIILRKQKLI